MAASDNKNQDKDKTPKKRPFNTWMKKLTSLKSPGNKASSKKTSNASLARQDGAGASTGHAGNGATGTATESGGISSEPPQIATPPLEHSIQPVYDPSTASAPSTADIQQDQRQRQAQEQQRQQQAQNRQAAAQPTEANGSFASLDPSSNDSPVATHSQNGGQLNTGNGDGNSCPTTDGEVKSKSVGGSSTIMNAEQSLHSGAGSNSVFSSSNHSSRSLTTTLTTIQSSAPSSHMQQQLAANAPVVSTPTHPTHGPSLSQTSQYFNQPFPTTPTVPASAVPAHMQTNSQSNPPNSFNAGNQPTTYRAATANNLLSDDASIMTLASSSQQHRRRNSVETNASIRAIAPSSQWGGSRESLPLSVLSSNTETAPLPPATSGSFKGEKDLSRDGAISPGDSLNIAQNPAQTQGRSSLSGPSALQSSERISVHSARDVNAPALSSERNSIYAGRTGTAQGDGASVRTGGLGDGASVRTGTAGGDGGSIKTDGMSIKTGGAGGDGASVRSVKSGMQGHGRGDSYSGSLAGTPVSPSPLASPKDGGF